jgi:uncharacterized protein (TIGR02466 family)
MPQENRSYPLPKKKMNSKIETLNIFPTPFYIALIEGDELRSMQAELVPFCESLEFTYKEKWGKTHLLDNTTFTNYFLDNPNLRRSKEILLNHIYNYIRYYFPGGVGKPFNIVSSWIAKYQTGDYSRIHNHGRCDISGAYYIKAEDDHPSFFAESPTDNQYASALHSNLPSTIQIKNKTGQLLLFPSYLRHGVLTNESPDPRLCLSFNVKMD